MGKDWRDPPTPPLGGVPHFQYSRVPRDRLWAVLFALVWVGAIAGGIYAIKNRWEPLCGGLEVAGTFAPPPRVSPASACAPRHCDAGVPPFCTLISRTPPAAR
jgi:hypothetical protein